MTHSVQTLTPTEIPTTSTFTSYIRQVNAHSSKVHSVNWNYDGSFLGSASVDKTASILALRPNSMKMTKINSCRGHTSSVDQILFSPVNMNVFATAAHDKTVRLWDSRVKNCEGASEMDVDEDKDDSKKDDKKRETANEDIEWLHNLEYFFQKFSILEFFFNHFLF